MEEEEDNYPLFCREYKLLYYFDVMEKGKKIVRWPPPWFIPAVTLLQIVLFWFRYPSLSEADDCHIWNRLRSIYKTLQESFSGFG